MSTVTNNTANTSLGVLSNEAESLLNQAREYRKMMDELPANDQRREVYEKIIRDLLERARRFSSVVTSTSSSS
jgi:cytochrome c-type biogenesis protein CcmH/NrfG